MAKKITHKKLRIKAAAPEEEFGDGFSIVDEQGLMNPGEAPVLEEETFVISEEGEHQLQFGDVGPESIVMQEVDTEVEFSVATGGTLTSNEFFLEPTDGVLFFDDQDIGRRVTIKYLHGVGSSGEVPEDSDTSDKEELLSDEDEQVQIQKEEKEKPESSKKKKKPSASSSSNPWHLESKWFHWEPIDKTVSVNNSQTAKLALRVDTTKGIRVIGPDSIAIKAKIIGFPRNNLDKADTKFFSKSIDDIRENILKLQGSPLKDKLRSLPDSDDVNRAKLTEALEKLNNDPKILKRIEKLEKQIASLDKKLPKVGQVAYNHDNGLLYFGPDAIGKTFKVEFFLKGKETSTKTLDKEEEFQRLESFKTQATDLWTSILNHPDPDFVMDTIIPDIEGELDHNKETEDSIVDLTSEFMKLEHLLHLRQQEDSPEIQDKIKDFVSKNISPSLTNQHSLASMLVEKIHHLSTSASSEGVPEFSEFGSTEVDMPYLRYVKDIRHKSNQINTDILDFSKYYMKKIASLITTGSTYFFGSKAKKSFSTVKRVFDKSGIDITYLQDVAIDAFREEILGFDREKRNKETIPDPKDFVLISNPKVWMAVSKALSAQYEKYNKEQTTPLRMKGSMELEVPQGGGVLSLNKKGILQGSLTVIGQDGTKFRPAGGQKYLAEKPGRMTIIRYIKNAKDIQIMDEDSNLLKRIPGANSETYAKVAANPSFFFYSPSQGNIRLSEENLGKEFYITNKKDRSAVNKDEYLLDSGNGTITFSAANQGQIVVLDFEAMSRSQRLVSPTIKDEEGKETSIIEQLEEQGADPDSIAEHADSSESMKKFLDVLKNILLVEEDPRLSDRDRAIMSGLLGIGQDNNQALSLKEIIARPPFNLASPSANDLTALKRTKASAASHLLSVLRDKGLKDKGLMRILKRFKGFLLGKNGIAVHEDKFHSYLTQDNFEEGWKDQSASGVKDAQLTQSELFPILLEKAGLSQDQENILRVVWMVPGPIRRDDASDESSPSIPRNEMPLSVRDAIHLLAKKEFPLDDGSPSDPVIVYKAYKKALEKIESSLVALYKEDPESFKGHFGFLTYYKKQREVSRFADELDTPDDVASKPLLEVEDIKPKEPEEVETRSVREEIREEISEDISDEQLDSTLAQIYRLYKQNKPIATLSNALQSKLDSYIDTGARYLDDKSKDVRAIVDEKLTANRKAEKEVDEYEDFYKEHRANLISIRNNIIKSSDVSDEYESLSERSTSLKRILFALREVNETTSVHSVLPSVLSKLSESIQGSFQYLLDLDTEDISYEIEDLEQDQKESAKKARSLGMQALGLAEEDVLKGYREQQKNFKKYQSSLRTSKEYLLQTTEDLNKSRKEYSDIISPLREKVEEYIRSHTDSLRANISLVTDISKYLGGRNDLSEGAGRYNLEELSELYSGTKDEFTSQEEDTDEISSWGEDHPAATKSRHVRKPNEHEYMERPDISVDDKVLSEEEQEEKRLSIEENKTRFEREQTPLAGPSGRNSLFEQLLRRSMPTDPDDKPKQKKEKRDKFLTLLKSLQGHFKEEKDIDSFSPSLSKNDTLEGQKKIIKSIKLFLEEEAQDLLVSPGIWDIFHLHKQRKASDPADSFAASPEANEALEQLSNNQPNIEEANMSLVHAWAQQLEQGAGMGKLRKSISKNVSGIGKSRNALFNRLMLFLRRNPSLYSKESGKTTFDFSSMYNGTNSFPSVSAWEKTKPLKTQLRPLYKLLQSEHFREELAKAKDEEDYVAVKKPLMEIEDSVMDIIESMSTSAAEGNDLEQMEESFSGEERFLFQRVRIYLNKINTTYGLANSSDDKGMSSLFGEGAPLEEEDSVESTNKFEEFIEETGLEHESAMSVLKLLQLSMEDGKNAVEAFREIPKESSKVLLPIVQYIKSNKDVFRTMNPGEFDLSSLTGIPFKSFGDEAEETPVAQETPFVEETPTAQESPAEVPTRKKSRGRLPKAVTSYIVSNEFRDLLDSKLDSDISDGHAILLDEIIPDWDMIHSYQDLTSMVKNLPPEEKNDKAKVKALKSLGSVWKSFLQEHRDELIGLAEDVPEPSRRQRKAPVPLSSGEVTPGMTPDMPVPPQAVSAPAVDTAAIKKTLISNAVRFISNTGRSVEDFASLLQEKKPKLVEIFKEVIPEVIKLTTESEDFLSGL